MAYSQDIRRRVTEAVARAMPRAVRRPSASRWG